MLEVGVLLSVISRPCRALGIVESGESPEPTRKPRTLPRRGGNVSRLTVARRFAVLVSSLPVLLLIPVGPTWAGSTYPSPAVCSDSRGVLGPQTCARVAEILTADELATTDEIAVVVIGTTGTSTIESYATALFNNWAVGKAGVDNGVLVVVAFDDRTMRIEVGAG